MSNQVEIETCPDEGRNGRSTLYESAHASWDEIIDLRTQFLSQSGTRTFSVINQDCTTAKQQHYLVLPTHANPRRASAHRYWVGCAVPSVESNVGLSVTTNLFDALRSRESSGAVSLQEAKNPDAGTIIWPRIDARWSKLPKPDGHYEPTSTLARLLRDLRLAAMDETAIFDNVPHPNRAVAADVTAARKLLVDAVHNSITLYSRIDAQSNSPHPVISNDNGFNRLFEEILCSKLPVLAPSKVYLVLRGIRQELDQQTRRINIVVGRAVLSSDSGLLNVRQRPNAARNVAAKVNRSTMTYD